jgi:hypothetical protein
MMRRLLFLVASVLVIITAIIVTLIALDIYRVPFRLVEILGVNYPLIHWIGWIGAVYIALTVPIYPIVKRRYPKYTRKVLNFHVVGNLLAVLLVSIHFTQQLTRPPSNYPDLGTGIILYVSVILLVATGMVLIYGL